MDTGSGHIGYDIALDDRAGLVKAINPGYYRIPDILILTKTDKLSKTKQIKQHQSIRKALGVDDNDLILFSAKSRLGKDAVWKAITALIQDVN